MKHVAYAAANTLTVAGLDFLPSHLVCMYFWPQIFKCLGQDRCKALQRFTVHISATLNCTVVQAVIMRVGLVEALDIYSVVSSDGEL